jgi:hypothetical protein
MALLARRILVLLVLGLTTLVIADAPAHAACTCRRPPLAQQVNKADAVFSGTVTMASGPTTMGKRQIMSYDVKVDQVYKGDISSPRVTVKSDADPAKCGLTEMTAEDRYLFFARAADNANLLANQCSGTGPAKSTKTQKVVALLGPGTTPNPPTPAAAEFTAVADAEPLPLARLAAPGAAMVLIGLLGLMVFGVLGRSRRS